MTGKQINHFFIVFRTVPAGFLGNDQIYITGKRKPWEKQRGSAGKFPEAG